MEELQFPTFELQLDAADQSQKTEVVQVGAGEPFKIQCIVTGEHHENHDFSWSKAGNELVASDTLIVADSPPGSSLSKTIIVRGFNSDSHVGSYECSVKRKDNTYQSRKMRLQKKSGSPQIADGFVACPKDKAEACLNGGICMMHKASESVSCLCLSENAGRHCEYIDFDWPRSAPNYKPYIAAMTTVIAAFLMLMCLCCCCFCSIKQRRQIKRLKVQIEKLRSSTHPEQESSPLIDMSKLLDNEVSAKLQSMDVQNDHRCFNVGSAQPSPVRSAVPAENGEELTTLFNNFSQPTIPINFGIIAQNMEEFLFPTFELRLDEADDQSQKTEVVQLGPGEPFKMQCIVTGEHHENHDLSWSKDGNELVASDTLIVADSPPGSSLSKTIVVTGFNTDSHVGSYECSVKREDNTYQSRKMRLQKKLDNSQIADGFEVCPKEKAAACLNGGICMMHKASESVSCLCLSESAGKYCDYFEYNMPCFAPRPQLGFAIVSMSATIIAFVVLMFLCCCCCYSIKQRRQIKRLKVQIEKLRSSIHPEQESSPLINMSNPLDNKVLAKLQSIDVQNDHHCYNVGSAQQSPIKSTIKTQNAEQRAAFINDFSRPTIPVNFVTSNKT
uniref:Uncharacterized protein n=1 Tax=Plectus sambesii TaxID=2011161 RepID=A0A914VB56_9BILA